MRSLSFFDDHVKNIEKDFFNSWFEDKSSWPKTSNSRKFCKTELEDTSEYNEQIVRKVPNEEIFLDTDLELILKIACFDFKPEDITIKIENNLLTIEALKEKKNDTFFATKKKYVRKIKLPENSITKDVTCSAKNNGQLTITIPKKQSLTPKENEKIIPIKFE